MIAEKEDGQIRISVWDSGPGIPPETLELVFGTLHQVNADSQSLGTGVRLTIAKEIVEAHGGRLFAEKLESGGRVTLTLPLSAGSLMAKLLIVDDEKNIRQASRQVP